MMLYLSGYLNNGWIPNVLPKNATNIIEINDIDNNHLWGRFNYDCFEKLDSLNSNISNKISFKDLENKIKEINRPKIPEWFFNLESNRKKSFICFKYYEYFFYY